MINNFKYIISVLLLLIFPISAIGLNITIHKCHHKGNYHISLFNSSKNHSNDDCCCSGCDMNYESNQMSSGCQMGHKKINPGCSEMNMSEQNDMSSDNCGIGEKNKESQNSTNESKSSKTAETGKKYYNALCCSNFEISNDISIQLYNTVITKDNFVSPLITHDIFQATNFNLLNNDKIKVKDVQYPLKGPIDYIISFIQSTSLSVDEAEPISSLLSHIA